MRSTPKAAWLVLGLVCVFIAASPAVAESVFSAGYEVHLFDGDDQWEVQTVAQTPKHQAIEHQFGQYLFSMTIREVSEETFTLLIDIKRKATGLGNVQDLLSHEFLGTFESILEFEAANEFLEAKGAISVGVIER